MGLENIHIANSALTDNVYAAGYVNKDGVTWRQKHDVTNESQGAIMSTKTDAPEWTVAERITSAVRAYFQKPRIREGHDPLLTVIASEIIASSAAVAPSYVVNCQSCGEVVELFPSVKEVCEWAD